MVGLGLEHRLTRVISKLKSQTHFEEGMVGVAWLAWPSHISLNGPFTARHVSLLTRPTPGLKSKPQGPRPNPSPPRVVAWAFFPNSSPIPHSLSLHMNIFQLWRLFFF
ncbi:hypothetical protein Hanom_Chr00s000004g01607481 [Helianthus anomalus]